MVAIQNFLASFGQLFVTGFEFVLAMFKDFFDVLKLLSKIPEFIFRFFDWIPPELLPFIAFLISIVIIYKILGREG